MRKIYARPGDYWQWTFEISDPNAPVRDIPHDVVLMSEDRPGIDYICRNNFDGTGDWVRKRDPSPARSLVKKYWGHFKRLTYNGYFWVLWYLKFLRFRWILYNRGFTLIRSTSFFSNLLTSYDYRKGVDVICFAIPLLIIHLFGLSQGAVYDLLLATAAAAIFDAFITVIPREQAKAANASAISKALYELVVVKNYQYRMIGQFQDSFWLSDSNLPDDVGMTREKGQALMLLMYNQWDGVYEGYSPNLPQALWHIQGETIKAFFMRAHSYLYEQVTTLQEIANPDLFPAVSKTLRDIHEHLQRGALMINFLEPQRYVTEHFKFIECLQVNFKVECHRYVGGEFDTRLMLNGPSIQELMTVQPVCKYADPRLSL